MSKKTCVKCKHEWIPRVENPVQCPACHSVKWEGKKGKGKGHGA